MLNVKVGSYFVFIGFYNGDEFITSGSDILPFIKIDTCYFGSFLLLLNRFESRHEISNNVVCATSKASDQPAHMRSLIRAFASHLNIL